MSWPLCVADEGRKAVDLAGGAQIVVQLIKSLSESPEPGRPKLLTVFCGMLMNYSSDNGKDVRPREDLLTALILLSPRGRTRAEALRELSVSVLD